jgi:hypothetical protein
VSSSEAPFHPAHPPAIHRNDGVARVASQNERCREEESFCKKADARMRSRRQCCEMQRRAIDAMRAPHRRCKHRARLCRWALATCVELNLLSKTEMDDLLQRTRVVVRIALPRWSEMGVKTTSAGWGGPPGNRERSFPRWLCAVGQLRMRGSDIDSGSDLAKRSLRARPRIAAPADGVVESPVSGAAASFLAASLSRANTARRLAFRQAVRSTSAAV